MKIGCKISSYYEHIYSIIFVLKSKQNFVLGVLDLKKITITGKNGEKLSIVQVFYDMKQPVEPKIYNYFEGK